MSLGRFEPQEVERFLQTLVQVDRPDAAAARFTDVMGEIGALGLQPGTAVMVSMANGRPFVSAVFALLALGLVPALVASSAPASRLERMAAVLGAPVMISSHVMAGLQPARAPHTTCIGPLTFLRDVPAQRYHPGEIILLTSGTSGIFSGCLFHVDALLLNAERHAQAIGQTAADTVLISLPMCYSYAFVAQLLATFALGGRAVISGPPFSAAHHERTLHEQGVTLSSLTPLMVDAWLQSGASRLPATLRRLTVGGDALPAASVAHLLARNPGLALYLTYGLTQAGPRVATLAAHLEPPRRHGSVGLPLDGVQVHLRKDSPDDPVGELIVDTDTGLLRRIGAAAAAPPVVSGNRQLIATGDLFEMDDGGYLYFRGRRPSFVVSRGEKVSLRSVCEVAETVPGVARAEAWVQQAAGGVDFTLDVYCDMAACDEDTVWRHLRKVLLRSELPAQLVLHPAEQQGWRKTKTR